MSANGKRKPSFLTRDEEDEDDASGGSGGGGRGGVDSGGDCQSPIDSLEKDLADDDDFLIDLKVSEQYGDRSMSTIPNTHCCPGRQAHSKCNSFLPAGHYYIPTA